MKTRKSGKRAEYVPQSWQLDPEQVGAERVQCWSKAGSMTLVSLADARRMVASKVAFVGSYNHICTVH